MGTALRGLLCMKDQEAPITDDEWVLRRVPCMSLHINCLFALQKSERDPSTENSANHEWHFALPNIDSSVNSEKAITLVHPSESMFLSKPLHALSKFASFHGIRGKTFGTTSPRKLIDQHPSQLRCMRLVRLS